MRGSRSEHSTATLLLSARAAATLASGCAPLPVRPPMVHRLPIDDGFSMGLTILLGFPLITLLFLLRPLLSVLGLWEVPLATKSGSLKGKVCIVTGSNCGIGLRTAAQLARLGATVVLACRDMAKAVEAAAQIEAETPGAGAVPMVLDLSKLSSVDAFAATFRARFGGSNLYALVCNAGVPAGLRQTTAEGFSLDFGVSFIGHFELVRALLPILQATEGARVVTLSSVMHWFGQRGATADWAMAAFDTYPLVRHAESPPPHPEHSSLVTVAPCMPLPYERSTDAPSSPPIPMPSKPCSSSPSRCAHAASGR